MYDMLDTVIYTARLLKTVLHLRCSSNSAG
jgi:hypothetical protein